jgi:nicotinamide-nucleotide amidase
MACLRDTAHGYTCAVSDPESEEDIDATLRSQPERRIFEELVAVCVEQEITVALAESLTAGEVALAIARVPDSGRVLLGGVITYATDSKRRVLGVEHDRVVSAPAARAMAIAARELFDSDIAAATTGVAGPAPQEGHRPGVVFVAVAARDGTTLVEQHVVADADDEPGIVRTRSAATAGELMLRFLSAQRLDATITPRRSPDHR